LIIILRFAALQGKEASIATHKRFVAKAKIIVGDEFMGYNILLIYKRAIS